MSNSLEKEIDEELEKAFQNKDYKNYYKYGLVISVTLNIIFVVALIRM
jgi:hypothetical protein